MDTIELVNTQRDPRDLETLTKLFDLHWQLADHAQKLYATEEAWSGMEIIDTVDQLAAEIDMMAGCLGYTIDQVTEPLCQPRTA